MDHPQMTNPKRLFGAELSLQLAVLLLAQYIEVLSQYPAKSFETFSLPVIPSAVGKIYISNISVMAATDFQNDAS